MHTVYKVSNGRTKQLIDGCSNVILCNASYGLVEAKHKIVSQLESKCAIFSVPNFSSKYVPV